MSKENEYIGFHNDINTYQTHRNETYIGGNQFKR